MSDQLREEGERLIREKTRIADVERREWRFTLVLTVANVMFALAPLLPNSERVFGKLTAAVGLMAALPPLVAVYLSVLLSRTLGSAHRVSRIVEAIESFMLYGFTLTLIFISEKPWSVFYALCPYTAMFWALTKPFRGRMYLPIVALAHGGLSLVMLSAHRSLDALICLGVGVVSAATFEGLARVQRAQVFLEAERNVLRVRVNEQQLDAERERITASLAQGVAEQLAVLASDLRRGVWAAAAQQAEGALRELTSLASSAPALALPRTVGALIKLLDDKCRPLAAQVEYSQTFLGDEAASLGPHTALAAVRIVQELVRNAVTHAEATSMQVSFEVLEANLEVLVRDDGKGLSAEQLNRGTGGLQNAHRWAAEQGGSVRRRDPGTHGTEISIILPRHAALESRQR